MFLYYYYSNTNDLFELRSKWSDCIWHGISDEIHLICVGEYQDHSKRSAGFAAFGGKELEPIPQAHFKFLLRLLHFKFLLCKLNLFMTWFYVRLAFLRTPNKQEQRWGLVRRAGSYIRQHTVMECMEFWLTRHVPQREPHSLPFHGSDLDSFGATGGGLD